MELMYTAIGGVISLCGVYWKLAMDIALLKQKVETNKINADESTNRLIKSIDRLELSIEKLTERMNEKTH